MQHTQEVINSLSNAEREIYDYPEEQEILHNLIEVQKELNIAIATAESIAETLSNNAKQEEELKNAPFPIKIGNIIGDKDFAEQLTSRTYEDFEKEHKALFSSGVLVSGYNQLDEGLFFAKGDLITIQARSNHGKSTLLLQFAHRMLSVNENAKANPMCVYITYESSPLNLEEKFLNLLGNSLGEGTPLLYNKDIENRYFYGKTKDFEKTISSYNKFRKENRLHLLKRVSFENLEKLIDIYQEMFPDRTLVLFLDYIQILQNDSAKEGWELIKEIAYGLEALAIKKRIVIFTASQENEKGDVREGKDIFNASTTMIRVFNHSHESIRGHRDHGDLFKERINGKSVCSLSIIKQKHGSAFSLKDFFLFNGFFFEENEMKQTIIATSRDFRVSK